MAIGVGSRVRPKLTSAAFTGVSGLLQPQPPKFGRVTKLTVTVADVLVEDGETVNVDVSALDEITTPHQTILDTFIDKVVVGLISAATATAPEVPFNNGFVGRVVDVFTVGGSQIRVLIRSLTNGMFYEMPFNLVGIRTDR